MTNELAIGLLIALLLAVGLVVVCVGRVVYRIALDAIRMRRNPPREMQHPVFGPLRWENEIWSGQAISEGREVDFYIAGPDSGPESRLEAKLRQVVQRLPEFERTALEFIVVKEPSLPHDLLRLESLDFLFEQWPENFGMGFTLPDDPDGSWRVELEGDKPVFVGRDD